MAKADDVGGGKKSVKGREGRKTGKIRMKYARGFDAYCNIELCACTGRIIGRYQRIIIGCHYCCFSTTFRRSCSKHKTAHPARINNNAVCPSRRSSPAVLGIDY